MKLTGDNSTCIQLLRRISSSDLVEFNFSSEWCSGRFEFFSSADDIAKLEQICRSIAGGKRKAGWLSEEGDLELQFSAQTTGPIRVRAICNPSVKLTYPGKLEFEVAIDLATMAAL